MKKRVLSMVVAALLLFAAFSAIPMSASAATKQDIMSAAAEAIPSSYEELYKVQLENILSQIDVSSEQADQIVALINEVKGVITDKGGSLHFYTASERKYLAGKLAEACEILNLTYTITFKTSNLAHVNDVYATIFTADGRKLCDLDGDIIKRTDVPATGDNSGMVALLGVAVVALAAGTVVVCKKAFAAE